MQKAPSYSSANDTSMGTGLPPATSPGFALTPKHNRIKRSTWQFWLLMALPLIWLILFCYIPMGGIVLAFKEYSPSLGIFQSPNVGLRWFQQFFTSTASIQIILNTLKLGFYLLIVGFPLPIILAIGINEVGSRRFKKAVQMITYAPYFISLVVLIGMMMRMMDLRTGVINQLLQMVGLKPVNFFGDANVYPHLYVWSGLWQSIGYSSIIYIAALAGVSHELQEAAVVDGATRLQRIWHVDIPSIGPTLVMMLIFNVGSMMNIGFEKAYLMLNDLNRSSAEIIPTFTYEIGLKNYNFGFSTAVGLFNSLVSLILFLIVNEISKKLTETSIW